MSQVPVLTGIGSLPPRDGPVEESLRAAVELQRGHGFGLFTDGEPRGDMLSLYAELPGIEIRGGVPRIVGRIRPLEDSSRFSKVRDLEFLQGAYPGLPFKMTLTAPTTFLLACAATGAGPAYKGPMDAALHDDLTAALSPIAHEFGRRGAYLQMDDPILSQGMRDYAPALRRLDALASEVPRERAIVHVCGGLVRSKALAALQTLASVSTLNLAFAGRAERENLSLIHDVEWEDRGLSLGAGAIDVQVSREDEIMAPGAVGALLRDLSNRIGPERIRFVLPDCGLRGTSADLVPRLLENLARGRAAVFGDQA